MNQVAWLFLIGGKTQMGTMDDLAPQNGRFWAPPLARPERPVDIQIGGDARPARAEAGHAGKAEVGLIRPGRRLHQDH